jgi:hypothetical protein
MVVNGRIGVTVIAAALGALLVPAMADAKPTADYQFNGNFKSSVGSAPKLKEVGPSGAFGKERIHGHKQGVWKWQEGTGLKLEHADNFLAHHGGTYTIVLLVNLDNTDGYRKLIDFKDLHKDAGLYVQDDYLYVYDLEESSIPYVTASSWFQITMTRDKHGKVKAYAAQVCPPMDICLVGEQLVSVDDPDKDEALGSTRVLHFLMNDRTQSGEETGGIIGRLRLYDSALSRKKVLNLKP